jgi:predicted esterase
MLQRLCPVLFCAVFLVSAAVNARTPQRLKVPGFNDAMVVAPLDEHEGARPVVVVLHGNFDRPEWECAWWQDVADFHGWVLCPRGVRTPWATLKEDRWTYRNAAATSKELNAALNALEQTYPGRVSRANMVLAGFSLGAIFGPRIVEMNPAMFKVLFLVEGGVEKLNRSALQKLKGFGIEGIGMAMSAPGRAKKARELLKDAAAIGLLAEFVDMKGAGHNYRSDFPVTGRKALKRLLQPAAAGIQTSSCAD